MNMVFSFNFSLLAEIIINLFDYLSCIISIYFVVAVTKVIMRGRRLSGFVGLIIFVGISFVLTKIDLFLEKVFPQKLNLSGCLTNLQMSSSQVVVV